MAEADENEAKSYELAFEEAGRALDAHERAVNELRSRAGVLIAAAAITTSFFGSRAIAAQLRTGFLTRASSGHRPEPVTRRVRSAWHRPGHEIPEAARGAHRAGRVPAPGGAPGPPRGVRRAARGARAGGRRAGV